MRANIPGLAITVFLWLTVLKAYSQTLFINEFLASNSSGLTDEAGENDDWVELFNPGNNPVDIGGMFMTDDLDKPTRWRIPDAAPALTTIPPGGFLLLWFDKQPAQGILHIDAKLGADGEDIGLFAADGMTQLDALTFGPQSADVSFGRVQDGAAGFQSFTTPTPGASNVGTTGGAYTKAPEVSVQGGFMNATQAIEMTCQTSGAEIRFTLDGSAPDGSSSLYTAPIFVSQNTVLRARAFSPGLLPSQTTTHSYLFGMNHDFPVVSLVFEPSDFFDSLTGIYPNFSQDWERPVHIEFFEPEGTLGFSQSAMAEIHGTASAEFAQKSLKIKAKADVGGGYFHYPVIPGLPLEKYKSFLLRNSGNDWNVTMFRDAFQQSLMHDISGAGAIIEPPRLYLQGFRPAVVYLNGVYWGILNLREHMTEDYVEAHFGVQENEMDFLENDHEARAGDFNFWNFFVSFLSNNSFKEDDRLLQLGVLLDLPHFLDYCLLNVLVDNPDWPGNNLRRWRKRASGEKWRFLTYDLDMGFGLLDYDGPGAVGWNTGDASNDALARALDSTQMAWPNPFWTTLAFRKTMENEQFRHDFINRAADFLNVLLDSASVNDRISQFEALYQPEIQRHFDRWSTGWFPWPDNVNLLRKFANERPRFMRQHVVEQFPEVSGTVPVTLKAEPADGGSIHFSTLTLPPDRMPWGGEYFTGVSIPVKATPAPGFVFAGWSNPALGANPEGFIKLSDKEVLTAYFQEETIAQLQTIDFQLINNKKTTSPPFNLIATASSGLPVTFSIVSGPATVSGNKLTLTGQEGIVVVRASQPGNNLWLAASDVFQSFNVQKPVSICFSKSERPWQEWIERIQFGSIDHLSFKAPYGNYSTTIAEVMPGQQLTLSITPAFSWEVFEEYFRGWIDFNQDGDFDDAGELVLETSGAGTVNAIVSVPDDVVSGDARMRISMQRYKYAEPCEVFEFGEVQDYTVRFTDEGSQPLPVPEKKEMLLMPNPVSRLLEIHFSTLQAGMVQFNVVNAGGVVLKQERMILQAGEHLVELEVVSLPEGNYWLNVQPEGQRPFTKGFIKAGN